MALADIIRRIEDDARIEADAVVARASNEAAAHLAEAAQHTKEEVDRLVLNARKEAEAAASTRIAAARLAARDEALRARRALLDEALQAVVDAIAALDDDDYVRLLGERLVAGARTGDTVSLGRADATREEALRAFVAAHPTELSLEWTDAPAPVERGVVLSAARTSLEITPRTLVEARRADVEAMLAAALFGNMEA